MVEFSTALGALREGKLDGLALDPEKYRLPGPGPGLIAREVLHAIDQPWGVSVGEVTVRAAGDHYLL
jgi:hypothetical protein